MAGLLVLVCNLFTTSWLGEQRILEHVSQGYLVQTLSYFALNVIYHRSVILRVLQPSLITIIYIGIPCSVGAWAFQSGNVSNMIGRNLYNEWRNVADVYRLISLCFFTLYILSLRKNAIVTTILKIPKLEDHKKGKSVLVILILISLLILSQFITTGIASPLKTLIAAAIFYFVFSRKLKYRYIVLLIVLIILSVTSYSSKREAIFAIPALLLIPLAFNPSTKFSLRYLFLTIFLAALMTILILAMSIVRGYGDFNPDNFLDAVFLIPDYLSIPGALAFTLNNFEFPYIFLHLSNSVSSSLDFDADLAYGSTYIRMLLIGPVGQILNYKPGSIIDQYTGSFFPEFREDGGSFGVTSIGEAAWNFGWFAPVAVLGIYFVLDKIFAMSVNALRSLSDLQSIVAIAFYQFSLYYARGSGLDILLIYTVFAFIGAIVTSYFVRIMGVSLPSIRKNRHRRPSITPNFNGVKSSHFHMN